MNEDDDRKKRKEDRPTSSSGTEGESERPNKRQRIVELPTIDIPSRPNLLEGLRQLGSNLALVSSENRIPSVQVSENFDNLQRELNEALEAAFSEAQTIVAQNEERQRAEERNAMAEAEYSHHQLLQQSFLQRLQPLTQNNPLSGLGAANTLIAMTHSGYNPNHTYNNHNNPVSFSENSTPVNSNFTINN